MTDNSPEYFEQLANGYPDSAIGAALCAAAALARENAELREWQRQMVEKAAGNGVLDGYRELGERLVAAVTRADSAESANRALQAEVERLNRAVERKNMMLDECRSYQVHGSRISRAIAYTGTEPQDIK